jgi:DNA helicase-2/ATP-dependent DNA helicase PcrA
MNDWGCTTWSEIQIGSDLIVWDQGLDGKTLDIARAPDKVIRVQAGPGTGKTFALQHRVMRLLEEGVDGENILVVTFTRVAAQDLRDSMAELGVEGCERVDARTLHSLCFSLLLRADVFPHLGRVPRPLVGVKNSGWLQFEYDPLLEDLGLTGEFGDKRARLERIEAFQAAWARRQRDEVTPAPNPVDRAFDGALISWLLFHQAILIGELVPIALRHLNSNALDPILDRYRYVICDEYQDLNKIEQLLIDKLACRSDLIIVGDPDQSIYSMKYASPEGIIDFEERHDHISDKDLDECRRCPTSVVAAANALIANNVHRPRPVPLVAHAGNPPGEIFNVQWPSMADEITGLSEYILHLLRASAQAGERRVAPGDIMVLSPSSQIGNGIRDQLLDYGVPSHSFYSEGLLVDDCAKVAMAMMNLLSEPDDRVALRYLLGVGSPNFLAREYAVLRQTCRLEGKAPIEILDEIVDHGRVIANTGKLVTKYQGLRERLSALRAMQPQDQIASLLPDQAAWAQQFRDRADAIIAAEVENPLRAIFKAMREAVIQPEVPSDPDFVRVMSLHKSKGLTSKFVIVAGAVQGSLPRFNDRLVGVAADEALEEQRRLFYVAITRPTEALVLSHYQRIADGAQFRVGAILNRNRKTYPSQFIGEAGAAIPPALSGREWLRRF